jgi:hypothetical protein
MDLWYAPQELDSMAVLMARLSKLNLQSMQYDESSVRTALLYVNNTPQLSCIMSVIEELLSINPATTSVTSIQQQQEYFEEEQDYDLYESDEEEECIADESMIESINNVASLEAQTIIHHHLSSSNPSCDPVNESEETICTTQPQQPETPRSPSRSYSDKSSRTSTSPISSIVKSIVFGLDPIDIPKRKLSTSKILSAHLIESRSPVSAKKQAYNLDNMWNEKIVSTQSIQEFNTKNQYIWQEPATVFVF